LTARGNEAPLTLGAREADSARYEAMVAYQHELLALARLLVGQDADARDLVQDTLEAAIRHAKALRDPDRLRPWLITIEARLASRARRRRWRQVPIDSDLADGRGEAEEDIASLRAALSRLPTRIRTAVVLHHMAGLSVDETAVAMGITANTVKTELKDGLSQLREMLR
jgi:RNA polymerase sigma-70 factor (ECF subfamily)